PPPVATNNDWTSEMPVAEIDARLRAAKWPVLTKYPRALVVASCLAIVKSGVSHNAGGFAGMAGREWRRPTAAGLLAGDRDAFRRLFENDGVLLGVFFWQMLHLAAAYLLAAAGCAVAWRGRGSRGLAVLLILLLGYFYLTVAIVGPDAYYRSRLPHMPLLYALAGLGLAALVEVVRKRAAADPARRESNQELEGL
ncbi:MAG: hypothetical protein ACREJB_08620, partial [Planctomycetaceae bacterium]